MGSSFKSMNSYNHNHNQRGNKPYALMLLLAFGAAILGVMVLHKVREKRIFTVLVKEKDQQLLTLHLLFQREKKFNQEARKKIEEMKNRVYFLRTQKLELDRRLLEMESTIASLIDERKVIESTLEDKKREVKMLTTGMNSSNGDPSHVTALQLKMQVDVQSERAKLVTSSTIDSEEENKKGAELQLRSDYSSDSEKSENRSRNDNITQRMNDHITDVEHKVSDVKDGRRGNEKELMVSTEFNLKRADKVLEEKKRANEMSTSSEEEQHVNIGSGDHRDQESQRYAGLRRGGLKLEKSDGSGNSFGSRLRRKHSKGKRRETVRNRRSGDELYSVTKKTESTPALTSNDEQQRIEKNRDEKAESEMKKELGSEDQLAVSDKINPTTETRNGGQSGKGETLKREERESKPTNTKSNGFEETEHVDEHQSMVSIEQNSNEKAKTEVLPDAESAKLDDVEKNARKQVSDEMINQSSDQEVNRKQEMTHSTEAKEHKNDNDESEAEDSEDAETHEPKIDRDDIKRFSESDPADEAEETEF